MKCLIYFLLLMSFLQSFSQETVERYVREGIGYHDSGDFQSAIEAYQHALYLNPNSSLANYEIAMTFSAMNEHDSAMKYTDKVLELDDGNLLPAYIIKGNTLDMLGEPQLAIEVYETALKKIGGHYMLYYNMGFTHYSIQNLDKVKEALVSGIISNPAHTSSHLLLGKLMHEIDQPVQSLLSLYYFLLIEPNSGRSPEAYQLIKAQLTGNAENEGNQINLYIPDTGDKKDDFSPAVLMLSMLGDMNLSEENQGKAPEEKFVSNTESFFKILGELRKKKNKGLWWEFYVPFFYELAKSDHLETYCYYISQSDNQNAVTWLDENLDKINALDGWLRRE